MKTVFFSSDEIFRGNFVAKLLSLGYNVYSCDILETFMNLIATKEIDSIFIDIDNENIDWTKIITDIKNSSKSYKIFNIIIAAEKSNKFLFKLVNYGINAVYFKNQSITNFLNKVTPILINYDSKNEKRKYTRVAPSLNENIIARIEVKSNSDINFIDCKLLNITPNASSIIIENENICSLLNQDDSIFNKLHLKIDENTYTCEGFILRNTGNMFIIKHANQNNVFKSGLANYICNKLNF